MEVLVGRGFHIFSKGFNKSRAISHLLFNMHCISTSTMNKEKVVEELKSNPYYEKYAKKIAGLQQTSPEEFLSRLEAFEDKTKKNKHVSKHDGSYTPLAGKPGIAKPSLQAYTKPKVLNDIMKVELIEDKSVEDIKTIWHEYHKTKDVICATIPSDVYNVIKNRAVKYPIFLLPLPRKQGFEFILVQFSENEVHFTPLISYQAHNENAPECLTIAYYVDLKDDKGIVLMRGEFNSDVLNIMEAQCLANELQLYYGEEDEKRTNLLEIFTNHPDSFKHMDLIANLQSLAL